METNLPILDLWNIQLIKVSLSCQNTYSQLIYNKNNFFKMKDKESRSEIVSYQREKSWYLQFMHSVLI